MLNSAGAVGRREQGRNARLYLLGLTASTIGDTAMSLAAGIWVKSLTGSNAMAGLVTAVVFAPSLAAPGAGLLADRVRRRPLLIRINVVMAAVLPVLLLVDHTGWIWLIFAVMACYGTALALGDPAESALFAVMFDDDLRARLNGVRLSIQEVGRLLAPLAGAALFVVLGGGAVALLDAATFAVAAALIARLRVAEGPPAPRDKPWREELLAGARQVWSDRELRAVLLAAVAAMLASGVAFPAQYAMLDALHRSASFLGVVTAVLGLGSLLAGLVSGRLITRFGERRIVIAGLLNSAVGFALLSLPWLPVALLGTLVRGFALPWIIVATYTLTQRRTPVDRQGRAAAAVGLLLFAPLPLAQLTGAGLISAVDYRILFTAAALTGLVSAAVLTRAQAPSGSPLEVSP